MNWINNWSDILHSSDIGEEKWEYNGTVQELFVDFEKAYSSIRREAFYYIITGKMEQYTEYF
jgi:hypothetical protein